VVEARGDLDGVVRAAAQVSRLDVDLPPALRNVQTDDRRELGAPRGVGGERLLDGLQAGGGIEQLTDLRFAQDQQSAAHRRHQSTIASGGSATGRLRPGAAAQFTGPAGRQLEKPVRARALQGSRLAVILRRTGRGLMRIEPFRMERMQSTYENYVDYNLSESGVRPMRASEILEMAGGPGRFLDSELGYSQSNGTEELRDRIAAFYDGARRDAVVVTNGGSDANYGAFWSLPERGRR